MSEKLEKYRVLYLDVDFLEGGATIAYRSFSIESKLEPLNIIMNGRDIENMDTKPFVYAVIEIYEEGGSGWEWVFSMGADYTLTEVEHKRCLDNLEILEYNADDNAEKE